LYEHTPEYFSLWALSYAFDSTATCPLWDRFLREVLNEEDKISLLQKWFGLCLTSDTSYQKLLMPVGAKRSGKGTTIRVLTAMLGSNAVASATFESLAGPFGLWPLLGKSVLALPDAHLTGRESARVLEILKSITGEDQLPVDRKFLPCLHVRLGVRIVISVNVFPEFRDTAGALEARTLLLPFEESFAGREDTFLEAKLISEIPGILNWSLRGLHALRQNGFHTPASAVALRDHYRRLVSPVSAFIDDVCELGPEHSVGVETLFAAWDGWCKSSGRDRDRGTKEAFGEQLRAAVPSIRRTRPRTSEGREYVYAGIRLRS
jgi:P4 family phage/plasmid primase-like protien